MGTPLLAVTGKIRVATAGAILAFCAVSLSPVTPAMAEMDVSAGLLNYNVARGWDWVLGSASVGFGVGANVLFGGFNKSVALQPVSVEGNQGLDVAAGVGALCLAYQP